MTVLLLKHLTTSEHFSFYLGDERRAFIPERLVDTLRGAVGDDPLVCVAVRAGPVVGAERRCSIEVLAVTEYLLVPIKALGSLGAGVLATTVVEIVPLTRLHSFTLDRQAQPSERVVVNLVFEHAQYTLPCFPSSRASSVQTRVYGRWEDVASVVRNLARGR